MRQAQDKSVSLGQSTDWYEHQGRQNKPSLGSAQCETGEEGSPIGRCMLEGHRIGASLFTGGRDALQQPRHDQEHRSKKACLIIGGQAADVMSKDPLRAG